MLKTSMLIQEESRIFDELLSRFDALSEEQMQVVGVTLECFARAEIPLLRDARTIPFPEGLDRAHTDSRSRKVANVFCGV
jgi:hypothetical protein